MRDLTLTGPERATLLLALDLLKEHASEEDLRARDHGRDVGGGVWRRMLKAAASLADRLRAL